MKNEMKRAGPVGLAGGAVLVLLVLATPAPPRTISYLWSFEEFASKADLVVVAEHLATVDTGRHTVRMGATRFVEMDSAFVVLAVLKAKAGSTSRPRRGRTSCSFRAGHPDLTDPSRSAAARTSRCSCCARWGRRLAAGRLCTLRQAAVSREPASAYSFTVFPDFAAS